MVMRPLAALALLAFAAGPVAAQLMARVTFEPLAEEVDHYRVRVRTMTPDGMRHGQTITYITTEPSVVLDNVPTGEHYIDVAACRAWGSCGPWSPVHLQTQDRDGDGVVGAGDFVLLVQDFDANDFIELCRRWGDATAENAIGVRVYL